MVPIVFVKKIEETTNKYPLPFSQSLPNDFYLTALERYVCYKTKSASSIPRGLRQPLEKLHE